VDKHLKKLSKAINHYKSLETNDKDLIEGLHKLRVTARKLVSLSPPDSESGSVFKKFIQASNHLRDLDVFRSEVLPNFPQKQQKAITELYLVIEEHREDLDAKFKLLIDMELEDELKDLLNHSALSKEKLQSSSERHRLEIKEIEKKLRIQTKLLRKIDLEDKQVHKARLKIKRLRYQLEHFYENETEFLKVTHFLQDELGQFHDLSQASKILAKHKALISPSLFPELEHFIQKSKDKLIQKIRKQLNDEYKKY